MHHYGNLLLVLLHIFLQALWQQLLHLSQLSFAACSGKEIILIYNSVK